MKSSSAAKKENVQIKLPGNELLSEWFSGEVIPKREKAKLKPIHAYTVYKVYTKDKSG